MNDESTGVPRQSARTSRVRVVRAREADYGADAFTALAGTPLRCEARPSPWPGWLWCESDAGTAGWVPGAWLTRRDDRHVLQRDYSAVELTVAAGEVLDVLLRESGWARVRRANGDCGWVPLENVEDVSS